MLILKETRMKDVKRKEQMKKWKRIQRRSQNCKLSKGIKLSCGLPLLNNYVFRGVSAPSTLMPTGMGSANPKFSKSGRKPKKTRHCTNPNKILISKRKEKKNGTSL